MPHDARYSMSILVVDDEPANVKLLEKILAKEGYERVFSTSDSRETLMLVEQHHPALVLLDLNMPYIDGFGVLDQLRARAADMPAVIVLTAQSDRESRLRALKAGARDFVTKPFDRAELLVRLENMLALQLAEAERLRFFAHFDSVTGLPNRNRTIELIAENLDRQNARRAPCALLLLALSQFKRINQSFGHEAGDCLLQHIKERLQQLLAGRRAILGRTEGARFLIALPGFGGSSSTLADFIQTLHDGVHAAISIEGVEIHPSATIGAAVFPDDADNPGELLARAETALAQAQQQNDLPYAFCNPGTDARVREQLELEAELHRALEREEFFLVYQPQVWLNDGRLRGVEALLRWRHPRRGVVSPAEFIPLLEQTGLIVPVGRWVLQTAFHQAHAWQQAGVPPLCMSVNLSPRQFQSNNLIAQVRTALASSGWPPRYAELEITESLLVEDFPGTLRILQTLEQMGMRIALDDFGTGYSALTYLHAFPFHALKIDRGFVISIGNSPKSAALLRGIVALGKSLQLEIVAEGIETAEQRRHLSALGCDTAQGFGLARPAPAEDLLELLRRGRIDFAPEAVG